MALLLHGILRGAPPVADTSPEHRRLRDGALTALYSVAPPGLISGEIAPDRLAEHALAHHAILQAYRKADVLPLRFGATFSNEDAVILGLNRERDAYDTALRHIAGSDEYAIALTLSGTVPCATTKPDLTGRAFLADRRRVRDTRTSLGQRRRAFAAEVLERLNALLAAPVMASAQHADRLLDLSILLHRTNSTKLSDIIESLRVPAAALALNVTLRGPWPPYSFVAFDPAANREPA